MRRRERLTLAAAALATVVAAAAPAACGGTHPTPVPPAPPPDAAVEVAQPPTAEDCGRSIDQALRLRGRPDQLPADQRATLIEDCVAHSTAADVACVLASPDLNALAQCEQNPSRAFP